MAPSLTQESSTTGTQTDELELAREAIFGLTEGFTNKLRQELFCELLKRLATEKEQRAARNLNHWNEHAKERIPHIAEKLLAERADRITTHLKAAVGQWYALARRITRNAVLADIAVEKTAWEIWQGKTEEDVSSRALLMNARDILKVHGRESRRLNSLDGLVAAAHVRGQTLDFQSHRSDDQDPLEILIARDAQRETDDELTYAIDNVHRQGNKGIRRSEWWEQSGLSELERQVRRTEFRGSVE